MPPHGCPVAALLTIACNLHTGIAVDQFRNRRALRQDLGDRIDAIPGICNLKQIGTRQGRPRRAIRGSIDGTLFPTEDCVKLGAELERTCRLRNVIR